MWPFLEFWPESSGRTHGHNSHIQALILTHEVTTLRQKWPLLCAHTRIHVRTLVGIFYLELLASRCGAARSASFIFLISAAMLLAEQSSARSLDFFVTSCTVSEAKLLVMCCFSFLSQVVTLQIPKESGHTWDIFCPNLLRLLTSFGSSAVYFWDPRSVTYQLFELVACLFYF